MIFITGDTHGDWMTRLNPTAFPEGREMTKNDYVIICGDFGLWHDSMDERFRLNWLNDQPWTTLFVDGNHENFDRLDQYTIEIWNGGKIHKINNSVFHLMRGQVFTIENLKFFCMGGAPSHDICDGILEFEDPELGLKMRLLDELGASYRVNHSSWWAREIPSQDEFDEGLRNLKLNNNEVDFIVSHSPSRSVLNQLRYASDPNPVSEYLDNVRNSITYTIHFFGHMHIDKHFKSEKAIGLYEQIIQIT